MQPLPPSKAGELVPGHLSGQSHRIRRGEGAQLPTPRTYRLNTPGPVGSSSGALVTLGTLNVFMQPGEILAVMVAVDMRYTIGASSAIINLAASPFGASTLINTASAGALATTYVTYGSDKTSVGVRVNSPMSGNFFNEFKQLIPFRRSDNGLVQGVATPTTVSLPFQGYRAAGSGIVWFEEFRAWAMVL